MCKPGHSVRPAKCFIQKVMQGQGREPFLTADDLCDFHQVVVHYVGEVVGGQLIGTLPEDFVVQGVRVYFHVATDEIVHCHDSAGGNFEADGPVRGGFQEVFYLGLRKGQRIAQAATGGGVVHEGLALGFRIGTTGVELIGTVKRIICPAVPDKLLRVFAVDGPALTLAVRGVGVFGRCLFHNLAVFHTLVRDDAAPVQRLQDILLRSRDKTVGVGILYADDEISALLLGIQIVVKGCAYAAHMKRTGG